MVVWCGSVCQLRMTSFADCVIVEGRIGERFGNHWIIRIHDDLIFQEFPLLKFIK